MAEIAAIAHVYDNPRLAALRDKLNTVDKEYRRVISITPCDLPGAPSGHTHSERLEWVDTQFLGPIDRLLDALDSENRHLLSLWPTEVVDEIIPDFDEAKRHLNDLKILAQHVAINIAQHRYAKLTFGNLIRFHIVSLICQALDEHLPELRPSRGTYDPTSKQYHGAYPAVVRRSFLEIVGLHEQLDRLIAEQVEMRRG